MTHYISIILKLFHEASLPLSTTCDLCELYLICSDLPMAKDEHGLISPDVPSCSLGQSSPRLAIAVVSSYILPGCWESSWLGKPSEPSEKVYVTTAWSVRLFYSVIFRQVLFIKKQIKYHYRQLHNQAHPALRTVYKTWNLRVYCTAGRQLNRLKSFLFQVPQLA